MTKIKERFPGDEHRQLYYMWREFPQGSKITLMVGVCIGVPFGLFPYIWTVLL